MSQRLLVVDDHRAIIEVLYLALRAADPEARAFTIVGEARNGETALRLCTQLQPDLVVLDIFLPDHIGIEVAKQMLAFKPTPKIVFYTSADEPVFVKEALLMGAYGYLCKHEAGIEELVEALRHVCNGGRVYPQNLMEQVSVTVSNKDLTARQFQAIALKAHGYNNEEIAMRLGISLKTLEPMLSSAYNALGVKNGMQAVYVLSKRGVI